MNRHDRRRLARQIGGHPEDIRAAKRAERVAQKLEARVLKMPPTEARRILAEWAAKKHGQSEIDRLNSADKDLLREVAGGG